VDVVAVTLGRLNLDEVLEDHFFILQVEGKRAHVEIEFTPK